MGGARIGKGVGDMTGDLISRDSVRRLIVDGSRPMFVYSSNKLEPPSTDIIETQTIFSLLTRAVELLPGRRPADPDVRCSACRHRGTKECPMYYDQDDYQYDEDRTIDDGFCDKGEPKV